MQAEGEARAAGATQDFGVRRPTSENPGRGAPGFAAVPGSGLRIPLERRPRLAPRTWGARICWIVSEERSR